jgi:Helix-turn-helix domain
MNDLAVAEWLGTMPARVRKWARQGALPHVVTPDGEFLFHPAELADWIEAHRRTEGQSREHATTK